MFLFFGFWSWLVLVSLWRLTCTACNPFVSTARGVTFLGRGVGHAAKATPFFAC
jgi:hypothetical protein